MQCLWDVCIHQAIKFHIDVEGFWYPEVDKDKCTDCGLCEKVCPIINKEDWHESGGFEKPHCYALINKNIEVRFDSTSGGAFSALADEIYKKSGYVGGAIYNEDWSVSQFLSSSREDLSRLRSSKYLQSHLDGFYIAVREALKTGKPVLVCGSPCQMAAMKRFLRKPYENLMVVDYICRGIASPLYFKQFINYLEQKHHSTVVYYKAKSKELGGEHFPLVWSLQTRMSIIFLGKKTHGYPCNIKYRKSVVPVVLTVLSKDFHEHRI